MEVELYGLQEKLEFEHVTFEHVTFVHFAFVHVLKGHGFIRANKFR